MIYFISGDDGSEKVRIARKLKQRQKIVQHGKAAEQDCPRGDEWS